MRRHYRLRPGGVPGRRRCRLASRCRNRLRTSIEGDISVGEDVEDEDEDGEDEDWTTLFPIFGPKTGLEPKC